MKTYVGWVLLAICLVCTYQGFQTSRGVADTEGAARSVVCDSGGKDCLLAQEKPSVVKADFMSRQYQFDTSEGPVTVTCTRQYIFFGGFSCTSTAGSLPTK